MTPSRTRVRAPGKVNIFLGVGDRQADGYHDLATVFQAVALYEDVTATAAADFSVEVRGLLPIADVPQDGRNLALRAARLLAARTGFDGGVHLRIRKEVPVAGGMGGGSADAAAALVACDALWQTGLSGEQLHELAASLGADVPFLLHGGTAMGQGKGDRLSPVLAQGSCSWVLVLSGAGMSTPAVYGQLDELRARAHGAPADAPSVPRVDDELLFALRAGDPHRLADAIHNDLQAAAVHLRPALADTIDAGIRAGALAGIVSGSGPTVALLCRDDDTADEVGERLAAAGRDVIVTTGPVPGARLIDA